MALKCIKGECDVKDSFIKYWFKGFERSLHNLDDESRSAVLKECGKSCSDSYTRRIYLDEYNASQDFDDFLNRLSERFPEIKFNTIKHGELIELTYNYCACDLVKNEYIKTPLLCECSRQSLLYNWGSVYGQDKVTVQLQQSILDGNSSCKFLISINPTNI